MGSAARSLAKAFELSGESAQKEWQHLAQYLEHLGKDPNWRRSPSILDQLRGWRINPGRPKSVRLSSASGGSLIDHDLPAFFSSMAKASPLLTPFCISEWR